MAGMARVLAARARERGAAPWFHPSPPPPPPLLARRIHPKEPKVSRRSLSASRIESPAPVNPPAMAQRRVRQRHAGRGFAASDKSASIPSEPRGRTRARRRSGTRSATSSDRPASASPSPTPSPRSADVVPGSARPSYQTPLPARSAPPGQV